MEPRGPHKGSGVCVFAGSGVGNDEAFSAAANDLGREIVRRDHDLAETHLVDTLAERKQLMADLAAGFVVLPGGLGTLDELTEMVTWTQLGVHDKPLVLLDVAGCWEKLSELLDSMVTNGFLRTENRALLQFATDAETAVAAVG